LQQLTTLAGECARRSMWSLPDTDLIDAVRTVGRAEQILAATRLHLLHEINRRNLPRRHGATSSTVWQRGSLRSGIRAAGRSHHLAAALNRRPALDTALSTGHITVEQAHIVAKKIEDLTAAAIPAPVVDLAEKALLEEHANFDADALRAIAERILTYVAPELAEEAERKKLERDSRRAEQTRALTLSATGDGRYRLTGYLDTEAAATVTAALDPLCKPDPAQTTGDARTPAQRRADALVDVCRLALHTSELPDNGGDRPQLMLTIDYDLLRRQLGAGLLDTGERLTPAQIRRLACDAQVIPEILNGDGQLLDLGRRRRLFTGPIRRALIARDRGCAFPACDRPPRWCDAHHIVAWIDDGPTSLDNGVLLCGHHHRLLHQGDWQVRLASDGRPEFIPPYYVDATRRPRRNTLHLRR
jgi:hypothetical protein